MKKKPSPSMVVALLALFVALSGTAVAGSGLILGTSIKAHSIPASKLTPTAVSFLKGQRGLPGPAGAPGIPGAPGATGPAGPAGGFNPASVQVVSSGDQPVNAGGLGTASVSCPPGTTVVGGGAFTNAQSLWDTRPSGNGWFAGATGYSTVSGNVNAYAICAGP